MEKITKRQRLIEYMQEFFNISARPDQPIDITLNLIADFCDLLRRGCKQDMERLILQTIADTPGAQGKMHLQAFGEGIHEGGDIELWGLPDCRCNKVECVYCGPRIARRVVASGD